MIRFLSLSTTVAAVMLAGGCVGPKPGVPEYHPSELAAAAPLIEDVDTVAAPAGCKECLTLADCIKLALSNRRTVSIAERQASTRYHQARQVAAEDWPQLGADSTLQSRDSDALAGGPGDRNTASGTVTLTVPLYDFGRTGRRYDAGLLRGQAASFTANRVRDQVELAVSRSYFTVLEAQKQKTVVDSSIMVLEEQRQVAQDYYDQGLVAKNDLLGAEVQLAERRQLLIAAQNDVRAAAAQLNRLIGMPVTNKPQLEDRLTVTPWNGAMEELFALAVSNRPDLAALQREAEAVRAEYLSAEAEYWPDVSAFGSYTHSSDSALPDPDWWTAGIALTVPIYQGGARNARLQELANRVQDAVDRRDELADDVMLEVKQAYLQLTDAAEQIPVARQRIGLAEENLEVTRARYHQGLVTQTDVLAEESRLTQARSDYFRALYAYHQAEALVRSVIGAPLPPEP